MTIMLFSNNGNKTRPFFSPASVKLEGEAFVIANADNLLFEQAAQVTKHNYVLAQDQLILDALNNEQNLRMTNAAKDKSTPRKP